MILITINECWGSYGEKIEEIAGGKVYFLNQNESIPFEDIEMMITYGLQEDWQILDQLPNLKWIQIFQTGIEYAPLKIIEERGILLTNVRGIYGTAISEYVMSIILYETRHIARFIQNQKRKRYDRSILPDEAGGKTVGIFGTGIVGKEVAKKAQAFDMNVLGFNTSGRSVRFFDATYTWDEKESLIQACDFIVLVLPLLEDTYHFLGKHEFQMMKENAYIINAGRGPLIQQDALCAALEQGMIKGAALDVFNEEPLPASSPLWETENLLITPHMAGKTVYFFDRCLDIYKRNFAAFIKGAPMEFMIDFEKGY